MYQSQGSLVSKQEFITNEHLEYLDGLRESGATNMFGAGCHLMLTFPELNENKARIILSYWMETFPRTP